MAHTPNFSTVSICSVGKNVYARLDEVQIITFQDIKETLSMNKHSHLKLQREITLIERTPSPYFFIISICPVSMKVYARFDEILPKTLKDIKKKTTLRTDGRTDG